MRRRSAPRGETLRGRPLQTPAHNAGAELFEKLGPDCVLVMADNPALPKMPEKPTLIDFLLATASIRAVPIMRQHLDEDSVKPLVHCVMFG